MSIPEGEKKWEALGCVNSVYEKSGFLIEMNNVTGITSRFLNEVLISFLTLKLKGDV